MKVERMRLAGRIIAYGITGFGGAMLIGEAVGNLLRKAGQSLLRQPPPTLGFC